MGASHVVAQVERTEQELPRWDLSAAYPGLESPELAAAFAALTSQCDALERRFDAMGVSGADSGSQPSAVDFEGVVNELNAVLRLFDIMESYLYGFVTTDSRNDLAQARQSELEIADVDLSHLYTQFTAWVGTLDLEPLIAASPVAAGHAFPLRKMKLEALHLMSPAEEELAAELDPSSGGGWVKLHSNLTSQIMVPLDHEGGPRPVPMSEARNLAASPERATRQRAYQAELRAWEAHALPLAAAMNGIKGQVNTLSAKRGWAEPLDHALFQNNIDQEMLDALLTAARESFPDFRRYLQLKASALGVPALAWYDLQAPLGESSRVWTWAAATAFVAERFGSFSDRMRTLAQRAYDQRWIDAGPRPGKVDGGFCMSLTPGESRILVNYSNTYEGVQTLAHELGHAYHNLNLETATELQKDTPMALAETASIFCETIVREAALANADPPEQLFIIEQSLQSTCQVVVDILSRFDFERQVFAARQERELSIAELNQLMLEAQRGTYGDGLDQAQLHPYMWAVKGHYYDQESSFYNYPYLFGLLFGLGLYARYREEPNDFPRRYDDLLAWTGRASAAELGERFGIDLRSGDFWRSSLDVIRGDVDRFERLIRGGADHDREAITRN
ncbi:MAG: M3 family oligoendopeptidase [Chloroflexota bacterium]|nr:M3 family oligoendopeptidase [Chloroflexota bacterium]